MQQAVWTSFSRGGPTKRLGAAKRWSGVLIGSASQRGVAFLTPRCTLPSCLVRTFVMGLIASQQFPQ